MNNKHLNDFLVLGDKHNYVVGDLVSYYTAKAIDYSYNGFSPCAKDYDKAFIDTIKKYGGAKIE